MSPAKRIRFLSLITLAAFLLNALLPFFAVYNLPQAAAAAQMPTTAKQLAELLGEKVLICTSDGFKWVSRADLQSGKEQPKPHQQYKCALCYLAAHGLKDALTPNVIALAPLPATQKLLPVLAATTHLTGHLFTRTHPSRAPPAAIIA